MLIISSWRQLCDRAAEARNDAQRRSKLEVRSSDHGSTHSTGWGATVLNFQGNKGQNLGQKEKDTGKKNWAAQRRIAACRAAAHGGGCGDDAPRVAPHARRREHSQAISRSSLALCWAHLSLRSFTACQRAQPRSKGGITVVVGWSTQFVLGGSLHTLAGALHGQLVADTAPGGAVSLRRRHPSEP